MKKIGGLDPFTLVLLVLVLLCAGLLGFEGLRRWQRPALRPAAPASAPAPAPAEQPKPEAPAQKPASSDWVGAG
jgi:hypothetical protein